MRPAVSVVNYANAHGCNLSCVNKQFREAMAAADLIFCDGNGVRLGALLTGQSIQERMTPPDWIDLFFEQCAQNRKSVFFVGEQDNVNRLFVEKVQNRHPQLEIKGRHHGYFRFDSEEEINLVEHLKTANPDYIFTGMGMPRQELWAFRMKDHLEKGVIIATGALFLWYAGVENRKKSFLTDNGFEWLVRYIKHPIKHFKRYILGNPLFIARIFIYKYGRSSEV